VTKQQSLPFYYDAGAEIGCWQCNFYRETTHVNIWHIHWKTICLCFWTVQIRIMQFISQTYNVRKHSFVFTLSSCIWNCNWK